MDRRVGGLVALVVAAVIFALVVSGVRLTTAEAKHNAQNQRVELARLREENAELRQDLEDLKTRHEQLLDYLDRIAALADKNEGQTAPPDVIQIPGSPRRSSDDSDNNDDSETRIIERNNTTTVQPPQEKDESEGDDAPIVKVPELPKLPDVGKTKDDLLKNTPLNGVL